MARLLRRTKTAKETFMYVVRNSSDGPKARIVQDNKVVCKHTTLHKATGKFYNLTTTFDFTDVSMARVLQLAAETLVIRWRTAFKNADKIDEGADNQVIEVKDLRFGKIRFTRVQKAEKQFQDLTVEDKKALLAKLMAEVGK